MKNYLGRLGLLRKATNSEVRDAITHALDATNDIKSLVDAQTILDDVEMRTQYERTHLQYEAINAALHCLGFPEATNTHRWTDRLVEFETVPEDPINQ
ncbi:MAG: hypothetical protein AB8B79_17780 [Granulosicoccus sp.]